MQHTALPQQMHTANRPLKVAAVTLGCKVNKVESDSIMLAYLARGARMVPVAEADVIVLNTCTVTGEAEKKTRKTARRLLRENKTATVIVTGCAAAISGDTLAALSPRISIVSKPDLLEGGLFAGDGAAEVTVPPLSIAQVIEQREQGVFRSRAGVKVQDGCDHACTYCIVHVARGTAWSRNPASVIEEACALARMGVTELVLTGIDLGAYRYTSTGCDETLSHQTNEAAQAVLAGTYTLATLITVLVSALDAQGSTATRIRISSVEPQSVTPELIDILAQLDGRVCRHLHLPLQSGSERVLAQMHRPYTREYYRDLVRTLKAAVPNISLSTDVIVGFPGETQADFNDTLELAREVGFTKIHVFRYSKRAGTPAAARSDQIPANVKEQRAAELAALGSELRHEFALAQIGKEEAIVVEGNGIGMTESYYRAHVDPALKPGTVIPARLTQLDEHGIFCL